MICLFLPRFAASAVRSSRALGKACDGEAFIAAGCLVDEVSPCCGGARGDVYRGVLEAGETQAQSPSAVLIAEICLLLSRPLAFLHDSLPPFSSCFAHLSVRCHQASRRPRVRVVAAPARPHRRLYVSLFPDLVAAPLCFRLIYWNTWLGCFAWPTASVSCGVGFP